MQGNGMVQFRNDIHDPPYQPNTFDSPVEGKEADKSSQKRVGGKVPATIFSVTLLGLILLPILENWKKRPTDDFPFSYYPMFSHKRSSVYTLPHVVGLTKEGKQITMPHHLVSAGGMNQSRRQLNRIVREGNSARLDRLCHSIAQRVANRKLERYKDVVTVQIVSSTFRLEDYFAHKEKTPLEVVIHTSYQVARATK